MLEKINLLSGGVMHELWLKRERAEQQAASLSPVHDIHYLVKSLPGPAELWYIAPRIGNEGALDAAGMPVSAEFFGKVERTSAYSRLAREYALAGNAEFRRHCALWLGIDPLGLADCGVPADEYSTWAAASLSLCDKNLTLEEVAVALQALYADCGDQGETISAVRATALAEVLTSA